MPRTGERLEIDVQELARRYVEEHRTLSEVASRFGCSETTIRRRLCELAIPARQRGPLPWRDRISLAGPVAITWSRELAYGVGLIATDGNLARDGRHLAMSSKDPDLLETLRRCLGLRASITPYRGGNGRRYFHVQWSDVQFHRWLLDVGLTPAKSLTLGPLAVPDPYFADFTRGCIDGDGSVLVYVDRYHTRKDERYVYERLYVSLFSASPRFLEWMQATIARLTGLQGSVAMRKAKDHHRAAAHALRYAKREAIALLKWMYYSPTVPCLTRKRATAERFLVPLGRASRRGVGRPRIGWLYTEAAPFQ